MFYWWVFAVDQRTCHLPGVLLVTSPEAWGAGKQLFDTVGVSDVASKKVGCVYCFASEDWSHIWPSDLSVYKMCGVASL